jgi:hypothetical protein
VKIKISKQGDRFVVDPISLPGSPYCGYGRTMLEAYGNFLISQQDRLGLEIEVDDSAKPAEMARRKRELAKR